MSSMSSSSQRKSPSSKGSRRRRNIVSASGATTTYIVAEPEIYDYTASSQAAPACISGGGAPSCYTNAGPCCNYDYNGMCSATPAANYRPANPQPPTATPTYYSPSQYGNYIPQQPPLQPQQVIYGQSNSHGLPPPYGYNTAAASLYMQPQQQQQVITATGPSLRRQRQYSASAYNNGAPVSSQQQRRAHSPSPYTHNTLQEESTAAYYTPRQQEQQSTSSRTKYTTSTNYKDYGNYNSSGYKSKSTSGSNHHNNNANSSSSWSSLPVPVPTTTDSGDTSTTQYQQPAAYETEEDDAIRTNTASFGNSLSAMEAAILRSTVPIEINETEEITVNGQRGIWVNRAEEKAWRNDIPISQYPLNDDADPEIINKSTTQQLSYTQEMAIRYLRPPTPPPPGDIVIVQESCRVPPPAPPLVIRQQPPRPCTPEPLVIREAPPKPPCQVGRKKITISGKHMPPPPRKVVIERLAALPSKPQSVLIERWLPYNKCKRRVLFQKQKEQEPQVVKPKNVIVQWEPPQVVIKKDFKYLGTIRANPADYVAKYGTNLKKPHELPRFVLDMKTPDGIVLAADTEDYNQDCCVPCELEGDVHALKYVDLDREGLSEYKETLKRQGIKYVGRGSSTTTPSSTTSSSSADTAAMADNLSNSQNNAEFNNIEDVYNPEEPLASPFNTNGRRRQQQQSYESFEYNNNTTNYGPVSGGTYSYNFPTDVSGSMLYTCAGNYNANGTSSSSINSNVLRVNKRENSILSEVVAQADVNRTGKISVYEAEKLLYKLNSRLPNRCYDESQVKLLFDSLELDHDGVVDLNEFKNAT